jgi:septum formation protein
MPAASDSSDAPLILASGSPRRSELLRRAGVAFEVQTPDVPELQGAGESPLDFVRRLSAAKAGAVASHLPASPARLVLGADTIVVIDGRVLGKPTDSVNADELLAQLLGRTHQVITGVAIVDPGGGRTWQVQVESRVEMRAASTEDRAAYVATGEGLDKAGAYALQGEGRRFVERVVGSETNVIGLPIDESLALLRTAREAQR